MRECIDRNEIKELAEFVSRVRIDFSSKRENRGTREIGDIKKTSLTQSERSGDEWEKLESVIWSRSLERSIAQNWMFQALLSKSGTSSSVGILTQRKIRVNELFSSGMCGHPMRSTAVNFGHRQRLFRGINFHRASSSFVFRVVRNSAEGFCHQLAVGRRIIIKSLVASKKIGGSKVENNFVEWRRIGELPSDSWN